MWPLLRLVYQIFNLMSNLKSSKLDLTRAVRRFEVREELGNVIGKILWGFQLKAMRYKWKEAKSSVKNFFFNSRWLNWTSRIWIKMEIYGSKGKSENASFIFSHYFCHGSGTFQVWLSIKFLEKYVSVCLTHRHKKGLERGAGIFTRPFQNAFLTPAFKKYSPTIFYFITFNCLIHWNLILVLI